MWGSVPASLFRGCDSFWVAQDSRAIVWRCGETVNYASFIPFDGMSSGMGVLG